MKNLVPDWSQIKEVNIVWFKRDLRLEDHGPLTAALRCEGSALTILVYILEPSLWGWRKVLKDDTKGDRESEKATSISPQADVSARQYGFLKECIDELSRDCLEFLGLPLLIYVGEALTVLQELVFKIENIVISSAKLRANNGTANNSAAKYSENYGENELVPNINELVPKFILLSHQETWNGWSYERDKAVKRWIRKRTNVEWRENFRQIAVLRGPASKTKRDGWAKRWEELMKGEKEKIPQLLNGKEPQQQPSYRFITSHIDRFVDKEVMRWMTRTEMVVLKDGASSMGPIGFPLLLPPLEAVNLPPDPIRYRQPGGRRNAVRMLNSFLYATDIKPDLPFPHDKGGERRPASYKTEDSLPRILGYQKNISSPTSAWEGCSRLSTHIAFGTISLREVFHAVSQRQDEIRKGRETDKGPKKSASGKAASSKSPSSKATSSSSSIMNVATIGKSSNSTGGSSAASSRNKELSQPQLCNITGLVLTYKTRNLLENKVGDSLCTDPRWLRDLNSFSMRLRWHCHFIQKLEDEPNVEYRNLHNGYDGLRNEAPIEEWTEEDKMKFDAWKRGCTGYPMVDACMRALIETGWINFRMRAMLVSFATFHLWLHWREPALYVARLFTDYEPGIHYSQFQMQAGTTGINTIRCYNPLKQSSDQSPDGEFLIKWIPEISARFETGIVETVTVNGVNSTISSVGVKSVTGQDVGESVRGKKAKPFKPICGVTVHTPWKFSSIEELENEERLEALRSGKPMPASEQTKTRSMSQAGVAQDEWLIRKQVLRFAADTKLRELKNWWDVPASDVYETIPIVDEKIARKFAMDRIHGLRKKYTVKLQSHEIVNLHGSRRGLGDPKELAKREVAARLLLADNDEENDEILEEMLENATEEAAMGGTMGKKLSGTGGTSSSTKPFGTSGKNLNSLKNSLNNASTSSSSRATNSSRPANNLPANRSLKRTASNSSAKANSVVSSKRSKVTDRPLNLAELTAGNTNVSTKNEGLRVINEEADSSSSSMQQPQIKRIKQSNTVITLSDTESDSEVRILQAKPKSKNKATVEDNDVIVISDSEIYEDFEGD